MLQLPVYQTPAGESESFWAARRSLMEMVVCMLVMLPQSSIQYRCQMGTGSDEIMQANVWLGCISWPRSQRPAGAQTHMHGGRSYLALDDILPPPAEDMMDDVWEEWDDDGETQRPNPRNFPKTESGFQKFERMLQKKIIRLQRYRKVIQNRALGRFADYEQCLVADEDVAWLRKQDYILNPPTADSSAYKTHTSSCPAAN